MANNEKRKCIHAPQFLEDLAYWVKTDRKVALKLLKIVDAVLRDPYKGLYKPEPLKYELAGKWSRRLTKADRVVYEVTDEGVEFLQGRYHY